MATESEDQRFKFDITFTVAHMLTTLGMVYALFSWGSGVNSALAVQDTKVQTIKAERTQDRAEMLQALRDIDRKLDAIQNQGRNK